MNRNRKHRISFLFSIRRRHTRFSRDWSSDVCSSDLYAAETLSRHDVNLVDSYLRLAERHENVLSPQRRRQFELVATALRMARARAVGDTNGVLKKAPQV